MRFLKVFLIAWFSFYAFYLVLALVLHVVTGYDPTAECAALTGVTAIEAAVSGMIEVVKAREKSKIKKEAGEDASAESEDYYGDVS